LPDNPANQTLPTTRKMPHTTLNTPTLVKTISLGDKLHYHLQPLFFTNPVATNHSYTQAVSEYKNGLKSLFKGFILSRENADKLFWHQFNPDIKYSQLNLSFPLGNQYVEGRFGVARFQLKDLPIICLPAFSNFMFIAEKEENNASDFKEQIQKVVQKLLRKEKDKDRDEFDIETYFSSKKEFVRTVSQSISIGQGLFKFEKLSPFWFFARMEGNEAFEGAAEIETVGHDLNSKYPAELKRAFYQDELVEKLYRIVFQKGNIPVVLIGEEGVGKHSVLEEVVWRYQSNFHEKKKGARRRLWLLNPNRIIAGMSIIGMWQKRFEAILKYLWQPKGKSGISDKLVVDNPVALFRVGKSAQNNLTLSHLLKPYLEKRLLQVILLANPKEWKIIQETDRSFSDLFQVIRIDEPDLKTSVKIVFQNRRSLELEHDCKITGQAINQLFILHRNYLKNNFLPGGVMKLLKQLASKHKSKIVDAPEVREEFGKFSGLQEQIFDEYTKIEKEEVEQIIGRQLIGQPQAVETLANVVHAIKAKLTDKSKPLGSFLFIGPTGVGKTQAAKVLCNYLMGNEDQLMRFDMNEYIDASALERLIGDYYNPEGQLTGTVRHRPFGVLLFDEIEKAHPKIHDLLLQVLDDARLTDSLGRTVDFSNTIIIMTSNVGARAVSSKLGFAPSSGEDDSGIYRKSVENYFRPEFVNRIDRIVIFKSLELPHILRIARLQIKELLQRDGFVRRTTILNISQDALEWVAKRGLNTRMGGRALKRQIERDLTVLSAEQLISTSSQQPIILNIVFKNGQLQPHIIPLNFVNPNDKDWIPNLPEEAKGSHFYNRLLRSVENLEREIARLESKKEDQKSEIIVTGEEKGGNLDWQYYDFKNKVLELKEQLQTIRLGFRDHYFKGGPAIPLRLKTGNFFSRNASAEGKALRLNYQDRLFQEEALNEISESYHFAPAQFDSIHTEFIGNFLNVAFLKLFARGFLRRQTDKVTLHFESCINGLGKKEIEFLIQRYATLFEKLDIQFSADEENQQFKAEGHSLYPLLRGEEGIHLLYIEHQNPLPVKLTVTKESEKSITNSSGWKVIRIYDGKNTLTDLRSGFSNEINIRPEEFKLLLYAGLPKELRKSLSPF